MVFFGGVPPQYPPGTSHGTGPQAPLQLLGAGFGPADPWFHSANQICCSGKFDLFLGPDTFQTLLPFIFYFFLKMGCGGSTLPRASLPLPGNLFRLFLRKRVQGGSRAPPGLLFSSQAQHLRVPFPDKGGPTAVGTRNDLNLGTRSPLYRGGGHPTLLSPPPIPWGIRAA